VFLFFLKKGKILYAYILIVKNIDLVDNINLIFIYSAIKGDYMENAKFLFKSLYNNDAVIQGRKKPWYFAAVLFVLGVFLTWIPFLSSGYTSNNSALLTSTSNQEIDKGFKATFNEAYFDGLTFKKDDKGMYLDMDKTVLDANSLITTEEAVKNSLYTNEYNGTGTTALAKCTFVDTTSGSTGDYAGQVFFDTGAIKNPTNTATEFYFDCISVPKSGEIENGTSSSSTSSSTSVVYEDNGNTIYLEAFYFPTLDTRNTVDSNIRSNFISSVILKADAKNALGAFPHSFAIYTKDSLYVATYALKSSKSNSAKGTYSGYFFDADSNFSGKTFKASLLGNEGKNNITDQYAVFASFLNGAATAIVHRNVWINIGILSAVVAGSVLVGAVILIIMHKRKTSVYRDTNFFECLKESGTLSFSPCLIAMIIGFLSSSYAIMAVIGCILLRVIWMMNKICPPVTQENKPVYKARS